MRARQRLRLGWQAYGAAPRGPQTFPGRLQRLSGARRMNCVFCRIMKKEIPASVVYEDDHTLAFMDLGQVNPGHVLVALKAHAENIYALDDAQAAAVFRSAARVARAIRTAFAPQGLSVYQANGAPAGQTV